MNGLALCAGTGMLDEGLRAGLEHLDIDYKTACYIERETFAASQLVKLMEEKCLDAAPIWDDLTTFDGKPWRGKIDCITGGFPCQPHSVAGKRAGLEDDRWIWPDIVRIIHEIEPSFCWFENVPGLVSTGGLENVLFDLAKLGFNAECGVIAASEIGASHQRERIFILAYRRHEHIDLFKRKVRNESTRESGFMERKQELADTNYYGRTFGQSQEQPAKSREYAFCELSSSMPDDVADSDGIGRRSESNGKQQSSGIDWSSPSLHAPGPASRAWEWILETSPWLAPAIESGLCMLVDGVALVVDESRADQLRTVGNGVVPLQSAAAFVQLIQRARIE